MDNAQIEKSWYTKYRPLTLNEYMGSSIKSLVEKRFRKRESMPHVIMIRGERGCGKTTFARLISKYYLCENLTEAGPCEQCDMCKSINEILISGESSEVECPGVTELDATIMNGKEAIQEVLDNALQAPIYSNLKVLIVDECHMISSAAQNSMLKIIEDIPSHLVVIFATTNPEKVLQTIKSRCQLTLEVKRQSVKDMTDRLMQIAEREKLIVSREALEVIAKKGNRVPRECISLLEDIAKTYGNRVDIEAVRNRLGGASSELYIQYFKAANKGLCDILSFIKSLKDNDTKIIDFVSGLMQFVMDSLYIKSGIALEEYTQDYVKSVKELFNEYTSSEFDTLLQISENMLHNINSEDDAKNDVILTVNTMRISKVRLLAKGLGAEQGEAITENKLSLAEHSKRLKEANASIEEIANKMRVDLDINEINDTFDKTTVVNGFESILDDIKVPELKAVEREKDGIEETKTGDSEIDSFFDD